MCASGCGAAIRAPLWYTTMPTPFTRSFPRLRLGVPGSVLALPFAHPAPTLGLTPTPLCLLPRSTHRFRASVEPLLVKDATMRPSADTTLATAYLLDHVRDTNHAWAGRARMSHAATQPAVAAADDLAPAASQVEVQSQVQSHSRSIQAALQSRSVCGPSPTGRHHSTLSTGSRVSLTRNRAENAEYDLSL